MEAVDPDVPVLAHALEGRALEPQADDPGVEQLQKVLVLGPVHGPAHVQAGVQSRKRILGKTHGQNPEGVRDQGVDVLRPLAVDDPGQGVVDLVQAPFLDRGQAGQGHDVEQKDQLPLVALARVCPGLGQKPGEFLVFGRQLAEPGQERGLGRLFPVRERPGPDPVQAFPQGLEPLVGEGLEKAGHLLGDPLLSGLPKEPGQGVGLLQPVSIALLEIAEEEVAQGFEIRLWRGPAVQGRDQPVDLVEAAADGPKGLAVQGGQGPEGLVERLHEQGDPRAGIGHDLVRKGQEVVGRVGAKLPFPGPVQPFQEYLQKQPDPLRSLGVVPEQMEVVETEAAGLVQDETPVFIGVADLGEEKVQPFQDALIRAGDILQNQVLGVVDHLDPAGSQVYLKGFGRRFHEIPRF